MEQTATMSVAAAPAAVKICEHIAFCGQDGCVGCSATWTGFPKDPRPPELPDLDWELHMDELELGRWPR